MSPIDKMIRNTEASLDTQAKDMKSICARTGLWIYMLSSCALLLGWLVASGAAAGIPVGSTGSGTLSFGALPPAGEWSTAVVSGSGGTAVDLAGLDTLVNTLAASGITAQLGTVSADPAGTTTQDGKWNSTSLRLTSRAGTTAATLFMATLQNTSGSAMNGLNISFTLSGSAAEGEDPGLAGYALYYSRTGAAVSWQRIGVFGTLGAVTINNVVLSGGWANNGTLYLLWVDDNGSASGDGWYGFDDVSFVKATPAADILTFGLPGNAAVITGTNIAWTVPYSTDVTTLAPTFTLSGGATAIPVSGTPRNFTTPQTYTVTSSDSLVTKVYTVTVTKAPVSSAKGILTFSFGALGSAVISGTNIAMTMPPGTAVTNLAPTYTVSPLATGAPPSGTRRNFSTPQTYTVTAEDGSTQAYVVTVSLSPPPWINVNIDTAVRTGLVGPAGGASATWNQQLGTAGLTASGLLDAGGAATTVGFTCSAGNVDPWGLPNLTLLTAAAFNFGANTPATLVLNGLPTGRKFDLYIACYYPNENGSKGIFSTTNTTAGAGTQSYDNGGPNGNSSSWVRGTNYVLFQSVVPDANHKITITFVSGVANFRCMVNGFQLVDVTHAPTTTTLARTAGANPSSFGDPVTFTATVTGTNAPSGNVTFYDGVTPMGTHALNGSFQASLTTSTLAIGSHTITARYAGNETNPPSDSAPLSHTVVDPRPATTTTLTLTSGTNPSTQGVSLTFTATVAGAAPTGNVSFYDRDRLMGTVALNGSGQASLTTSTLPCGARSITARYAGDANNAPGVSARFIQTVNPPSGNGKLKVFLLAGQSNMQGYGKLEYGRDPTNPAGPEIPGGLGCLRYAATNNPLRYDYLLDPLHPVDGKPGWITRSDVWVSFWDGIGGDPMATTVERRRGILDSGFGVGASLESGLIGPEYGFGLIVGSALADPVLLIKTAWGGKSLAVDFRPPSSGNTGTNYTLMVSKMHLVLDNLATYYPGYNGAGYDIAGFGWHQGWNDRVNANYTAQYETNLANLIRDIRAEFGKPRLPFVIGNTGMADAPGGPGSLIEAQFAVTNTTKYPDFAGNVTTVDTRPFDYGELQSPNGFGYHWYWNGESYFNIGESMGLAMMALLSPPTPVLPVGGCRVTGGVPTFTFPTVAGYTYRLVYKNQLTDAAWQALIAPPDFPLPNGWSAISTGSPMSLSDADAAGQPQRFYRLEAANP